MKTKQSIEPRKEEKLKILFDLTPLCRKRTGIPIFAQRLYEALKKHPNVNVEKTFSFCKYIPIKPWKLYRIFERVLYRELYLPFKLYFGKYDVYIESDYMFIPLFKPTNTIVVTIIYDIGLLLFDGLQRSQHPTKWKKRLLESIQNSDILLTISQSSLNDIVNNIDNRVFAGKRLDYIYADADELEDCENDGVLNKFGIKDDYFLFLGTLEPRKNPLNLIKAFHLFKESDTNNIKLVFACKKGWLYEDVFTYINKHHLQNEVIFTGYVSDQEKTCLLSNAQAFVFLSVYEGFGIPPLEALKSNTPALVSDIPVFHELFENSVLYADPNDERGIAEKMEQIIYTPPRINKDLFKKFSWEKSAEKFISLVEDEYYRFRNGV